MKKTTMAELKKSNPKLHAQLTAQLNKNRRQSTTLTSHRITPPNKRDYERYILNVIENLVK